MDRKKLLQEIKTLGIGISANSFGQEGIDIRASINNMVEAKQIKINELKAKIDDSQALDKSDWAKLGWGTAINITSSVADIVTLGESSILKNAPKAMKSIKDPLEILIKNSSKLKGSLYKAVKIAQSKPFIFVKMFVEDGFTVYDKMMGIINGDEATANMVNGIIGIHGDLSKEVLQSSMEGKKGKFAIFLVGALNDIVTNIIKGSNETLLTDKTIRDAMTDVLKSVGEMVPIVGQWYAQFNLANKVVEDIDK